MAFPEIKDADTAGYVLDFVEDLPPILIQSNGSTVDNTYIYANGQILAQHTGGHTASRYFFLHDRLGSVRLVIDTSGNVKNRYIYGPFGRLHNNSSDFEEEVPACGSFRFTGQYFDSEIDQYYPHIDRFTTRDPILGQFEDPLSLHKYLYCRNEPINKIDLRGLWTFHITGAWLASFAAGATGQMGVVFDDEGNVGGMVVAGLGAGSPAAGIGVSFGLTNADTIYDLEAMGVQLGATVGPLLVPGFDVLFGGPSSNMYTGFEVTPGFTMTPTTAIGINFEIHTYVTQTMVIPIPGVNWRDKVDEMTSTFEDAMFNAKTWGEAYSFLFIWGMLPF